MQWMPWQDNQPAEMCEILVRLHNDKIYVANWNEDLGVWATNVLDDTCPFCFEASLFEDEDIKEWRKIC